MVDPFWEVTPLKAVTETVTQFILQPLEIAGASIGKFSIAMDLRQKNYIHAYIFICISILVIFQVFSSTSSSPPFPSFGRSPCLLSELPLFCCLWSWLAVTGMRIRFTLVM